MPSGGARPNTGGKRPGAGRPPGSRWRPAVAAMRVAAIEHMQKVVDADTDPLVICLSIATDVNQPVEIRLGACGLALPCMYPRLTSTIVEANHTITRIDSQELMDRIAQRIAKQQVTIDAELAEQPTEASE